MSNQKSNKTPLCQKWQALINRRNAPYEPAIFALSTEDYINIITEDGNQVITEDSA